MNRVPSSTLHGTDRALEPTAPAAAWRVGRFDVWSLHDGTFAMPAAMIARGISADDAARLFGSGLRPDGHVELQVNVMLVRWGSELVLIDAGAGTAFGPTLGFTGARLRELGFSEDDVTAIAFTHLHLDHVAGALDLEQERVRFPRARYLTDNAELAFWSAPNPDLHGTALPAERRAAVIGGTKKALRILGERLEVFRTGASLWPGFTSVPLPGHTPHHCGFLLEDAGECLLNAGDAFIDPRVNVPRPELSPAGDILPDVSARTRRELIERCERERLPYFCAHYPAPGIMGQT